MPRAGHSRGTAGTFVNTRTASLLTSDNGSRSLRSGYESLLSINKRSCLSGNCSLRSGGTLLTPRADRASGPVRYGGTHSQFRPYTGRMVDSTPAPAAPGPVLETKFYSPGWRAGQVQRPRLVERVARQSSRRRGNANSNLDGTRTRVQRTLSRSQNPNGSAMVYGRPSASRR
jgi:hypothetical protein